MRKKKVQVLNNGRYAYLWSFTDTMKIWGVLGCLIKLIKNYLAFDATNLVEFVQLGFLIENMQFSMKLSSAKPFFVWEKNTIVTYIHLSFISKIVHSFPSIFGRRVCLCEFTTILFITLIHVCFLGYSFELIRLFLWRNMIWYHLLVSL